MMIRANEHKTASRLGFSKSLLALVAGLAFAAVADSGYAADDEWTALQIVDVNELPYDEAPRFRARSKTFFRSDKGTFIHARWSPTWSTEMPSGGRLGSHYHLWNEWAYILRGDFVIQEPVSPYQRNGAMYRYVQGTWLDRPPYTLHRLCGTDVQTQWRNY